ARVITARGKLKAERANRAAAECVVSANSPGQIGHFGRVAVRPVMDRLLPTGEERQRGKETHHVAHLCLTRRRYCPGDHAGGHARAPGVAPVPACSTAEANRC